MTGTKINLGSRRGAMSIFILVMLSVLVLCGLSLFEVQLASFRDVHHSHSLSQARFLAQSALQEGRYYTVKVDPSWTGTSDEQFVNMGSYEYTTARNVTQHQYTVTATGYVPNKTNKNSTSFSFSTTFQYNPIPVGIIILDSTAKGALDIAGNADLDITASDGQVFVNSNHSQAVQAGGNATLTVPDLGIVGSYSISGNAVITGNIVTGMSPRVDPLAWVPTPLESDYTVQQSSHYTINDITVTINPGVYIGGIEIRGNAVVTMSPGVYYMKGDASGGGFMSEGNAVISGSKVMIYNDPTASTHDFDFSTNGAITLTPPDDGDFVGILFYQRRNSTVGVKLTSNTNTNITGAFYAAKSSFDLTGNGNTGTQGSAYVLGTLKVTGNGVITITELP